MVHPTAGHHHKLVQHANINMHVVPLSQHVFTSWGSQSVVTANKLTQLTAKCLVPLRDDMTATLIPPPTQVRPGSVETKGQIKVTVITLSPSGKSYPPSSCIGGGGSSRQCVQGSRFPFACSYWMSAPKQWSQSRIFKCDNHRYWDSDMKSFIRAKLALLADSRSKHSLSSQKQTHGEALLMVRNSPNGHREMPSYGRKTTPETSGQEDVWANRQWG